MNSSSQRKEAVEVILTFGNGDVVHGRINCGLTPDLANALNRDGQFIEFIDDAGRARFLAKSAIAQIEPAESSAAPKMNRQFDDTATDPYRILGIAPDTGFEAAREAYHQLAKRYHPDRIASANLPDDMRQYATAVLTRLNSAWDIIKRTHHDRRAA